MAPDEGRYPRGPAAPAMAPAGKQGQLKPRPRGRRPAPVRSAGCGGLLAGGRLAHSLAHSLALPSARIVLGTALRDLGKVLTFFK